MSAGYQAAAPAPAPAPHPALQVFIAEMTRWREARGLSKKRLADGMGYHPSYVTKIENAQQRPTDGFVGRADEVLQAGGALRRAWRDYESRRKDGQDGDRHREPEVRPEAPPDGGGTLIVEHDDAKLRYVGGTFHAWMRRKLRNWAPEPVTRYPMRISVDRYPDDAERSNHLYRERPLTWSELGLVARCGDEDMTWQVKQDRDAVKEVWLLFENDQARFPLYPGEATWIEYGYTVGEDKWGPWFQRAVRLPTRRLSVCLAFPADLDPMVWGTETSLTAGSTPLRTAIQQREDGGERCFEWSTEDPQLHAHFRLEWRFRAAEEESG